LKITDLQTNCFAFLRLFGNFWVFKTFRVFWKNLLFWKFGPFLINLFFGKVGGGPKELSYKKSKFGVK